MYKIRRTKKTQSLIRARYIVRSFAGRILFETLCTHNYDNMHDTDDVFTYIAILQMKIDVTPQSKMQSKAK